MNSLTYCCPVCRETLKKQESCYHCKLCEKDFPIVGNIPLFSNVDNYYGEIPQEEMRKLIHITKHDGYKKALSSIITNSFVLNYTINEKRAAWASLLPLGMETDFLDVGCGWGTNTVPIARKVRRTAAIDATLERVRFVELRCKQNNLFNVDLALASAISLPYPAETFDVVSFNGVLEWLGAINKREVPQKIQLKALAEAYRVLKPGGIVYIGIENRFSLRYFLGEPDDHSFIRFNSLMPRWMAQVYCKLCTGKDYFMHTHSLRVYRQMLRKIGYSPVSEYCPWPDYRNPETFIRLEKKALLDFLCSEINRVPLLSRKWVFATILKWLTVIEGKGSFCHSFSFVWKK